jgi:murein DD-endopeptidase MepM/ murein hydrolase activator NlpD
MSGLYEPEGIYLSLPLDGKPVLFQGWGDHPEFHARCTYNGIRLKGHIGLDLLAPRGTRVLAADGGRVIEISVEPGGFGRYIKIEHTWGESFYAGISAPSVDTGQSVTRGHTLALVEAQRRPIPSHLHFGIRIKPYNRLDGWGGFTDPLPYLYMPELQTPELEQGAENPVTDEESLPPMLAERPAMRRP